MAQSGGWHSLWFTGSMAQSLGPREGGQVRLVQSEGPGAESQVRLVSLGPGRITYLGREQG